MKVRVTVGRTTWLTSLFPATGEESYILPVKAAVRKAESLTVGAAVDVTIELVDL